MNELEALVIHVREEDAMRRLGIAGVAATLFALGAGASGCNPETSEEVRDTAAGCPESAGENCGCSSGVSDAGKCAPETDVDRGSGIDAAGDDDAGGDATEEIRSTVALPVLVYPEDGKSQYTTSRTLYVEDASTVDRLWVQAHQPFYHRGGAERGVSEGFDPEGAASIRVNGGPWVEVRDENVDCAYPENEYRCVAGGYSTIRFTIPVDAAESGLNDIEFRFNGTKGVRSGYRVLDLDLRDDDGNSVVSQTAFDESGYDDREAPYDSTERIEAGRTLFQKRRELVENPKSKETIVAACNDCHTESGQDLTYFNYSNRSIEARSRFHGLTAEQGKEIASYIRSIDLQKRDGSSYEPPGTPWDPPYQPGPTLMATDKPTSESDQVYWAAGAGLEAVLDRDREMLAHLFPKEGDPSKGVDWRTDEDGDKRLPWEEHIDLDNYLNPRVMPIAMQFPDWNNWLPDVHPIDANPNSYEDATVVRHRFGEDGGLRKAVENYDGDLDSSQLQDLDRQMQRFTSHFKDSGFLGGYADDLTSSEKAAARIGAYQWKAVKLWEIHHGHNLQDAAEAAYGPAPRNGYVTDRIWMGTNRTLFDIGPHISRRNKWKAPHSYGTKWHDRFMTHPWYQLQAVVNPGSDPGSNGQNPMDWNYQRMFLGASVTDDVGAAVRNYQSIVMKWQLLSSDLGVNGNEDHDKPVAKGNLGQGWGPDTSRLGLLNGMVDGALYDAGIWKNLPPDTLGALYTAALAAWNDFNMQYDPADFPRSDERHTYPPEDYEPPHPDRVRRYAWVDQIYYGTQKAYRYLGVDREVIERTYRWAEKMWPKLDWMGRLESGHAAVGSGTGLRAEVYEDSDVTGDPVETFVDDRIQEKWAAGEGPSSVPNGTYAIRWTGEIQPFFEEKLHLYFLTQGGLRVWLDGEKIIDNWSSDNRRFDHHETDQLEKGKRYSIRIEYERKDRSRQSQLKFMWGGERWLRHNPSRKQYNMVVPLTQLYPGT